MRAGGTATLLLLACVPGALAFPRAVIGAEDVAPGRPLPATTKTAPAPALPPLRPAPPAQPGPDARLATREFEFRIPATVGLARALELFSEQSGLPVAYAAAVVQSRAFEPLQGRFAPAAALDRLLRGSGLAWETVAGSIVLRPTGAAPGDAQAQASGPGLPPPPTATAGQGEPGAESPEHLEQVVVRADPWRSPPLASTGVTFGIAKSVLDTPRSLTVIGASTIDLFGAGGSLDLADLVPGVFTTARFGVQGALDVRNVPADVYFRGMKRLSLRGHARKVAASMDTIEIVGGPASPIHGMGKIGGYTNLVPKSGRAGEGRFLEDYGGFAQAVTGSYAKQDLSFGLGGPMPLPGDSARGGFYVYGLAEDSGAYAMHVPVQQRLLQVATSIDGLPGGLRLETGANLQKARTAGALTGRLTQSLVDGNTYVRGEPLADLDADRSGAISFQEMHVGSPVAGPLSVLNQPLMQAFAWPVDAAGRPVASLVAARPVAGIPRSLYDYLVANPARDPGGWLRAAGVGGPLPLSGAVPLGLALDPSTVATDRLDLRRAAAFERELDAEFTTLFLDVVADQHPRWSLKNQLFFDGARHTKDSQQPFAQEQQAYAWEEKLTLTRRIGSAGGAFAGQALLSANLRQTVSRGRSSGLGDFSNTRTDAMAGAWALQPGGLSPNTTFVSPFDNADPYAGGSPWQVAYRTAYVERGLGVLVDADWGRFVNVIAGIRYDDTSAENTDFAGSFDAATGDSARPGGWRRDSLRAAGRDGGASWSTSLSLRLPGGWRPYATLARSSILLDGNDNSLSNALIDAGHVGSAELREVGLKATLLEGRLFLAGSLFRQARLDVDYDDPLVVLDAYPTATVTRGWNLEAKWAAHPQLFLAGHASLQTTYYEPNVGGLQVIDARAAGFSDITDGAGRVVYPAEAFLYGGRAWLALPDGLDAYRKRQGNPDLLVGVNAHYRARNGFGLTAGASHFSGTCTGRLCTVRLPEVTLARAGLYVERADWLLKLDVQNLFDTPYFRARTGDALGNVLAQAMAGRTGFLTLRRKF
jgi:iron complex outermembrane recepter protein